MASVSASSSSSSVGGSSASLDVMNDTSSGDASAGEIQVPTIAPKSVSTNFGDSCTWYQGNRCYLPRDCYDCINVNLQRDSCAVDPNGMCVSMSTYQRYASQQDASDADFYGFFPSANFTYCPLSDATCRQCKERWRQQYWNSGIVTQGATCVGAGGCICVSMCERPNRINSIVSSQCSYFGTFGNPSNAIKGAYIAVGLVGFFLLGLIVFRTWAKSRRDRAESRARHERRERRRNREPRTGPPLALTGWNSLRAGLLESEREFIQGEKPKLGQIGTSSGSSLGDGDGSGRRTSEDEDSLSTSSNEQHDRRRL
ncbi:hypothetical protein FI667_g11518, partial [Globisporangium splendens]